MDGQIIPYLFDIHCCRWTFTLSAKMHFPSLVLGPWVSLCAFPTVTLCSGEEGKRMNDPLPESIELEPHWHFPKVKSTPLSFIKYIKCPDPMFKVWWWPWKIGMFREYSLVPLGVFQPQTWMAMSILLCLCQDLSNLTDIFILESTLPRRLFA